MIKTPSARMQHRLLLLWGTSHGPWHSALFPTLSAHILASLLSFTWLSTLRMTVSPLSSTSWKSHNPAPRLSPFEDSAGGGPILCSGLCTVVLIAVTVQDVVVTVVALVSTHTCFIVSSLGSSARYLAQHLEQGFRLHKLITSLDRCIYNSNLES